MLTGAAVSDVDKMVNQAEGYPPSLTIAIERRRALVNAHDQADAALTASTDASATVTTSVVTNGPVADTPENRAKYGAPMSNAGKRTAPSGN